MNETVQFERGCRQLMNKMGEWESKQLQNVSTAAKMIRDLAIVLPGPLESVIGMKKSSINLPTGTLPESYARMLCILKHSEKEYMKDSDALDSFLFMSMLHFILGEKVRGLRDLQFLTKAYRDVFHCRKVASLLQQRQKRVVMCKLYAELMDIRPMLVEIDFNKLRNCLDTMLKDCEKYAEVSEVKIPKSNMLAIRVVCMQILADPKYEAQCYRMLKAREEVIEQFKSLFCFISLQRYVKHTLELAVGLVSITRNDNWMINATYSKYVGRLMDKYCNTNYISQGYITNIQHLQQSKTIGSSQLAHLHKQIQTQLVEYEQPKPTHCHHRLTNQSLTTTDLQIQRDKRKLLELTVQSKRTLVRAIVDSCSKSKTIRPKIPSRQQHSFSYNCLKHTSNRGSKENLDVLDNAVLKSEMLKIAGSPTKKFVMTAVGRTSILDKQAVQRRQEQKRRSRESKQIKYSSKNGFEELQSIRLVQLTEGCLFSLEVEPRSWTVTIKLFNQSYCLTLLPQIRSDNTAAIAQDPSTSLARIKVEIETCPFYSQFLHRMGLPSQYNLAMCHDYLAERKRQLGESRFKLFNYLRQYLIAHVRWSHRMVVRLSGKSIEKWQLNSTDSGRHTKELKELLNVLKDSQLRVSMNDIFKQKRRENLCRLMAEVLLSRTLLAWEVACVNGEYCLRITRILTESLSLIKVNAKKLDISSIGIAVQLYDLQGEQLIKQLGISHLEELVVADYILHKDGLFCSKRLSLLGHHQKRGTEGLMLKQFCRQPVSSIDIRDSQDQQPREMFSSNFAYSIPERDNFNHLRNSVIKTVQTSFAYRGFRYLPLIGYSFVECFLVVDTISHSVQARCSSCRSSLTLLMRISFEEIVKHMPESKCFLTDTNTLLRKIAESLTTIEVYTRPCLALSIPSFPALVLTEKREAGCAALFFPTWRTIVKQHVKTPSGHSLVVTISFNFLFDMWQLLVYDNQQSSTKLGYLRKNRHDSVLRLHPPSTYEDKYFWKQILQDAEYVRYDMIRNYVVVGQQVVLLSELIGRDTISTEESFHEVQIFKSHEPDIEYHFQLLLDLNKLTVYYASQPTCTLKQQYEQLYPTWKNKSFKSHHPVDSKLASYLVSLFRSEKINQRYPIDKHAIICQRRCLQHIVTSDNYSIKLDLQLPDRHIRMFHNQQWTVFPEKD